MSRMMLDLRALAEKRMDDRFFDLVIPRSMGYIPGLTAHPSSQDCQSEQTEIVV